MARCFSILFSALFGAVALVAPAARAQVGIGTTTPSAQAALDIKATDKGLLIPRLTAAQRTAIAAPPQGLLVYQTDGSASGGPQTGFWYYAGSPAAWVFLNPAGGAADNLGNHTATQALNLQANALTGTGDDLGAAVGLGVRADGGLNLGQNTTGNNLFLGYQSGHANTSGSYNQFLGYRSGYFNTTGSSNYFSGYSSGLHNTTGSGNLFVGYQSGQANTTGTFNQFVGHGSGYATTTGIQNTFGGYQSGQANLTGSYNLFSGFDSGYANTTGNSNVFVGSEAGYANTTGSNNTFLGYRAGPTTGGLTNAAAIGYQARASQSNTLILGGTTPQGGTVNVGIGTTAPQAALHVLSATYETTTLESGDVGPHLAFKKKGLNSVAYVDYVGTDYAGGTSSRAGALELRGITSVQISGDGSAGSPDLTVRNNGRVGIGTVNPGTALEVVGQVRTSGGVSTDPGNGYTYTSVRTKTLLLGPSDLTGSDYVVTSEENTPAYAGYCTVPQASTVAADIVLPDGAVITQLDAWIRRASSSDVCSVTIERFPVEFDPAVRVAYTTSLFLTNYNRNAQLISTTAINAGVVDNSRYRYVLTFRKSEHLSSSPFQASQTAFYRAKITYTTTRAD